MSLAVERSAQLGAQRRDLRERGDRVGVAGVGEVVLETVHVRGVGGEAGVGRIQAFGAQTREMDAEIGGAHDSLLWNTRRRTERLGAVCERRHSTRVWP